MVDWEKLFAASTAKLTASLQEARAAMDHSASKGHLNEEAFATWLRPFLPQALDVTTGQVIDSTGSQSRQADVVIFDRMKTPRFLSRAGLDVIPIEPVFAAVEIKTFLNKTEIESAFENMKSLKSLQKLAYHGQSSTSVSLYGSSVARWPVQFFVFAYESDSLDTVLGHVERLNVTQPIEKRIDAVCVLDKGLIVNLAPEGLHAIPRPNSSLIAKPSSKPLLTFYALLSHVLGQAVTDPMAMHPYLAHISH